VVADVLVILLAVLVTWVVALALVVGLLYRQLRRSNRVATSVPSPAPVRWRWSPSESARLHRRLQVAVWPIDPARPAGTLPAAVGTDELRADLVATAVRADLTLAGVRRAPGRIRRTTVRAAAREVATIEELCARLQSAPPPVRRARRPSSSRPLPPELDELAERVRCLEYGRAEIDRISRTSWPALPTR
jgi:hypothetical protein